MRYEDATITGPVNQAAVIPSDVAKYYQMYDELRALQQQGMIPEDVRSELSGGLTRGVRSYAYGLRDRWLDAGVQPEVVARMYNRTVIPHVQQFSYPYFTSNYGNIEETNPESIYRDEPVITDPTHPGYKDPLSLGALYDVIRTYVPDFNPVF